MIILENRGKSWYEMHNDNISLISWIYEATHLEKDGGSIKLNELHVGQWANPYTNHPNWPKPTHLTPLMYI